MNVNSILKNLLLQTVPRDATMGVMKQKILIADDDHDLVSVLGDRLISEGYETINSYEGIRTIEAANRKKPDLIVLDWMMPTGNGSRVLESLSERESTRDIPVIILTGVNPTTIAETAKQLGVKKIMRKPYEFSDLLTAIQGILKKTSE